MSTTFDAIRDLSRGQLRALAEATTDPDELELLLLALAAEYAPDDPEVWLGIHFGRYVTAPLAEFHRDFWRWVWRIEPGRRARPRLNVWGRGSAKSTSAQLAVVGLGHRRARKYGLYVTRIQDKADDHVASIGSMLGSTSLAKIDPELCTRAVTQYGTSRGWKRNRLHTAAGFIVDALGLDAAARGAKVDEQRPDFIIIDDVDTSTDSPGVVKSMITRLSRDIIPAGSGDCIVLGVQNLVNPDGVFAQIMDGRAEMLGDVEVSGPIPAIAGSYSIELNPAYDRDAEELDPDYATVESRPWIILGGEFTWEGQNRDVCEQMLANMGPTAFKIECQHEKRRRLGGMYDDVLEEMDRRPGSRIPRAQVRDLVDKTIWLDPSVTDTDGSDAHGCQCDGIDEHGVIYRLRSWEERAAPRLALRKAVRWAYEEGVSHVGIEMNVGSDMSGRSIKESWENLFESVVDEFLDEIRQRHGDDHPYLRRRRPWLERQIATGSTGSKADRSQAMHADYERPGRIVHVIDPDEPYHEVLEAALGRAFIVKPFDLSDAALWSWKWLRERQATPSGTNVGVLRNLQAGSVR